MIITKMALPRRTFLRGLGATVALPLLDAMVPAASAMTRAVSLSPLKPYLDNVTVVTNLEIDAAHTTGNHASANASFLTCVKPKRTEGSDYVNGTSVDQVAAQQMGGDTPLPSLELGTDLIAQVGNCDNGYACAYMNSLSWASPTSPNPTESDPRIVFERLFGDTGSTDPEVRRARLSKDASLLDSVTERANAMYKKLGASDETKLAQYLEAVRDVERRIQMAEAQSDRELPVVDQPAGIPDTFGEHARLMFDMMALAWETDMTRVATFMMGREITGRTYAEIGVPDAHHPISHHQRDPVKLEKLLKINSYHMTVFAEFLERLRTSEDADGSMLDSSMIVYGAGMADSNSHYSRDLPILLAGNVSHGGYHLQYPEGTPLSNLHLSLLDKLGTPVESLGDSSGRLSI